MTNQDKKLYLSQYVPALRELDRLEQEIKTWRARAEGLGRAGDGPSGGGDGRAMENAVGQIDALERRLAERTAHVVQFRSEILQAISKVADTRQRLLLELKYIDGFGWAEVAQKMHMSERGAYYLHGRALDKLFIDLQ